MGSAEKDSMKWHEINRPAPEMPELPAKETAVQHKRQAPLTRK
jgi:hypothetical protein